MSPANMEQGRFPLKQVGSMPLLLQTSVAMLLLGAAACCAAASPSSRCRGGLLLLQTGARAAAVMPLLLPCSRWPCCSCWRCRLCRCTVPAPAAEPWCRCCSCRCTSPAAHPSSSPRLLQRDDAINAGFAWFREKGLIPAGRCAGQQPPPAPPVLLQLPPSLLLLRQLPPSGQQTHGREH